MTRDPRDLFDFPRPLGGNDLPHAERRLADADPGSKPGEEAALGADQVHTDHDDADISESEHKHQAQNIEIPDENTDDNESMDLGTRIRQARQRLGLRQEDLARRIRVKQSAISQWESGKFVPGLEHRMALAAALRIALHDLMPEAGDFPPEALKDPQTRRIIEYFWKLDPHTRSLIEMLFLRMLETSVTDPPASPPNPAPPRGARSRRR